MRHLDIVGAFKLGMLFLLLITGGCSAQTLPVGAPEKFSVVPCSVPKQEPRAHVPKSVSLQPANGQEPFVEVSENATDSSLPNECHEFMAGQVDESLGCIPPQSFAIATCQGHFPDLAMVLFERSSPWTRLYFVTTDELGSQMDSSEQSVALFPGEEVLVMRHHGPEFVGMLQVSDGDDVDVLRWDGTCVTLDRNVLQDVRPQESGNMPPVWQGLGTAMRRVLLTVGSVRTRFQDKRKSCGDSSTAEGISSCLRAVGALDESIVSSVRAGIRLPVPRRLPIWNQSSERRVALD